MENKSKAKEVFETLSAIDVSGMVEKKKTGKTELSYLSWANAIHAAKSKYPNLEYEVKCNPQTGLPYWYDPLTGYLCRTSVTIEGKTHEMWLPVMSATNYAMKAEAYKAQTKYNTFDVPAATMMDVNKTIMRCLVKNLMVFGLGASVFGVMKDDLPDDTQGTVITPPSSTLPKAEEQSAPVQQQAPTRDDTPVTPQMLKLVRDTLALRQMPDAFVAKLYKREAIDQLVTYQAQHIIANIDKLQAMYAQVKPQPIVLTPAERELGITEADLEGLIA